MRELKFKQFRPNHFHKRKTLFPIHSITAFQFVFKSSQFFQLVFMPDAKCYFWILN